MAIAYRNSSSASGTSLYVTVNKPLGTQDNDFLLMFWSASSTSVCPTPSGWTKIAGLANYSGMSTAIFYKIAFGEPASYQVLGSNGGANVQIMAFSGVSSASPYWDSYVTVNGGNSNSTPQATTHNGDMMVFFISALGSTTFGTPSGMTAAGTDNGANLTSSTFYETFATTTSNITMSSSTTAPTTTTATIALIPDGAPSSTPPKCTVVSVDHYKISNETGMSQSHLQFTFDQPVSQYTVNVNGTSPTTGTVAFHYSGSGATVSTLSGSTVQQMSGNPVSYYESGGIVASGTSCNATIDWTDLGSDGTYQVNIYGKNANDGSWTPYDQN